MEFILTNAELLLEKGIRPSVQRLAVFNYLKEHPVHPTAEKIYSELAPENPTLSKTTVYNTLHLFSQKNLVTILRIEDEEVRYDGNTSPHLHFKCRKCGRIIDIFDEKKLRQLISLAEEIIPSEMELNETEINFQGICSNCRN